MAPAIAGLSVGQRCEYALTRPLCWKCLFTSKVQMGKVFLLTELLRDLPTEAFSIRIGHDLIGRIPSQLCPHQTG